ncbi:MAG TPA: paraquat-inducible protein A [Methylophilaceae bacterium]|nr:paraquat-inducible protein A [Methylophilaceae bacterium]
MQQIADLIACEHCDAVYRKPQLKRHETALCQRCGAELEQSMGRRATHLLPLTIASLIMFLIANTFPIVGMELQGIYSETTLLGAVLTLNTENMPFIATAVLATTILFPLFQLLILLYLLLPAPHYGRLPAARLALRMLQMLRPWGMVEVFVLGVIVALVKLTSMATVIPGIALWAMASLALLLAAIFSFDPRYLWRLPAMDGRR